MGMPARSVGTRSARLQPTRLRAVEEGRALPDASILAPREIDSMGLASLLRLAINAVWGPQGSASPNLFPGMYRLLATIELAPWRISPIASVAAPRYWAWRSAGRAKGCYGRWLKRDSVGDFVAAHSFRCA